MVPHRNIHKPTWTSSSRKTRNEVEHILIVDDIRLYAIHYLSGKLSAILNSVWLLQKLWKDWQ